MFAKHFWKTFLAALLICALSSLSYAQGFADDDNDTPEDDANSAVEIFTQLPARLRNAGFFDGEPLPKGVTESFETAIVNGLRGCQSSIDIRCYHLSLGDVKPLYFAVLNRHPELFFVKNAMNVTYRDNAPVEEIKPAYTTTNPEKIAARQARIDEAVSNALSLIPEGASDLEKALILHDYIATHCDYDTTLCKPDSQNIYGVLIRRRAVCTGYALTYRLLLQKVGVSSICVPAEGLMHVWNMVTVDGQQYHVDVTLDDPVFNDKIIRRKFVKHENFLRSDAGIKSTSRLHGDWDYREMTATSTRYDDYFWKDVNEQIPCLEGFAYAFMPGGQLMRYNLSTNQPDKMLLTMTDRWFAWNDPRTFYSDKFSSVVRFGRNLIFNDHTRLFIVDLVDGKNRPLTQEPQSTSVGVLYGLMPENANKIAICLAKDPSDTGIYSDFYLTPVTSIQLDRKNIKLKPHGRKTQLRATILPADATYPDVRWMTSDPTVATVTPQGLVEPRKEGTAVITVFAKDNALKDTCNITVTN